MKIVIDTNVVISGVFFGGIPRKILTYVTSGSVTACATPSIVDEYNEIVAEMIDRKSGKINKDILLRLLLQLEIITPVSHISICRDPDDNAFLECAEDAKALYIVSGDNDLLSLEQYKDIRIITAKEFYDSFIEKSAT